MTIRLKPDLERLFQQDVQRGGYASFDEFLECAIQMLNEQEEWLSLNQFAISGQIYEGYASAQRGELIDVHRPGADGATESALKCATLSWAGSVIHQRTIPKRR